MILCDSLRFERQLTASPLQVHYGRSESRSHWHAELIDERVSIPASKGSASVHERLCTFIYYDHASFFFQYHPYVSVNLAFSSCILPRIPAPGPAWFVADSELSSIRNAKNRCQKKMGRLGGLRVGIMGRIASSMCISMCWPGYKPCNYHHGYHFPDWQSLAWSGTSGSHCSGSFGP